MNNLLRNTSLDEYISNYEIFDINNPPENKKDYLKLRNELMNQCKKFTGHVNNERKLFINHDNFYISLISKTSQNIDNCFRKNNLSYKKQINDIKSKNKKIYRQNQIILKQKKKIQNIELSNSWKLTKPLRFLKNVLK